MQNYGVDKLLNEPAGVKMALTILHLIRRTHALIFSTHLLSFQL